MRTILCLLTGSVLFAETAPDPAEIKLAIITAQRNSANQQLQYANAIFAMQLAKDKAEAAGKAAAKVINDAEKSLGCKINLDTAECIPAEQTLSKSN